MYVDVFMHSTQSCPPFLADMMQTLIMKLSKKIDET